VKTPRKIDLNDEKGRTLLNLGYDSEMSRKVDVTDSQEHVNTMEENGGILRTNHIL
jgi:hypothetical protein